MPLPDERPRQSVANLIGRFEKQKPSASSSAPPIGFPRTSSVISQRTDDSAQEEVKEKREWPPKGTDTSVSSVSSSIQFPQKQLTPTPLTLTKEKEQPILSGQERPSPPEAPKPVSPSTPQRSTPAKAKPPSSNTTAIAKVKSPPPTQMKPASTRTSDKSPVPKNTAKVSPNESPKQTSSTAVPSNPLKSQQTGQSTASTHTTTRIAAKPRASAPPKTPVVATPARSRTPLAPTRPKTPSSVPRTGTPSSTARPKTPSGLYAPTAASLARSKVGAPAPPPPEKPKRKVTTDLSKPTAASASRMRSPAITSAVKVGKGSTGKPTAVKVSNTGVTKAATPPKRHAVTKPPTHEKLVAGDDKKIKDSSLESTAGGEASGATAITATSAVVADVLGDNAQDVAEGLIPRDSQIEGEPEHIDHLVDAPEESTQGVEHLELEAQQYDSHDGEEIESYDEDFPEEDSPKTLETFEGTENGHVTTNVNIPLDPEQPVEEHVKESGNTSAGAQEVHNVPEEAASESIQKVPDSHKVDHELHHTEHIVEHEPVEEQRGEGTKGPNTGSDLEDIVNMLESGPHIPRPTTGSLIDGTASEAGEIPDEF